MRPLPYSYGLSRQKGRTCHGHAMTDFMSNVNTKSVSATPPEKSRIGLKQLKFLDMMVLYSAFKHTTLSDTVHRKNKNCGEHIFGRPQFVGPNEKKPALVYFKLHHTLCDFLYKIFTHCIACHSYHCEE